MLTTSGLRPDEIPALMNGALCTAPLGNRAFRGVSAVAVRAKSCRKSRIPARRHARLRLVRRARWKGWATSRSTCRGWCRQGRPVVAAREDVGRSAEIGAEPASFHRSGRQGLADLHVADLGKPGRRYRQATDLCRTAAGPSARSTFFAIFPALSCASRSSSTQKEPGFFPRSAALACREPAGPAMSIPQRFSSREMPGKAGRWSTCPKASARCT